MSRHQINSGNNGEVNITVRSRSRLATGLEVTAAGAALVGVTTLLWAIFGAGGIKEHYSVEAPRNQVFEVAPLDVSLRAIVKSRHVVPVAVEFGTPVDHVWGLGVVARAAERTTRNEVTFTDPKDSGQGGEIDTLYGARGAGMSVQELAIGESFLSVAGDGSTTTSEQSDGSLQIIDIPASDIVEFSGINPEQSAVIPDNGNFANLGDFVWEEGGGLLPNEKRDVLTGEAALASTAEAAAVNEAQTTCAVEALPEVIQAMTQAERGLIQAEYDWEKGRDPDLAPFNINDVVVEVTGTFTPDVPYKLPHGEHIENDGKPVSCSVDPNAFSEGPPGQVVDPDNQELNTTSMNNW